MGLSLLYTAFISAIVFGVALEIIPVILFMLALGGSTAAMLAHVFWLQFSDTEKMTEAKSLVKTYNERRASLLIAKDTSPKNIRISTRMMNDGRGPGLFWNGCKKWQARMLRSGRLSVISPNT